MPTKDTNLTTINVNARVYTPDATGRCTVCARPEAEHSRSGGWEGDESRCMPAEVTAETVTACSVHSADNAANGCQRCGTEVNFGEFHIDDDITADTLTRQHIRDHYGKFSDALQRDADEALAFGGRARAQRARVAAAINARAKGGR